MEGLVLGYDGRVGKVEGMAPSSSTTLPTARLRCWWAAAAGMSRSSAASSGTTLRMAPRRARSSPRPRHRPSARRRAPSTAGKGVVFVYGNYSGDNMNFDMAAEFLAAEGIDTRTIRVRDDVAVGAPDRPDERRGIAGDVL